MENLLNGLVPSGMDGVVFRFAFRFLVHCCIFLGFFTAQVQGAQPGFRFKTYNTRDGLSDNIVTAIFQDRTGYMWFGTVRGLNRFDGYSFEVFDTRDGLLNDNVRAVTQTPDERIWVGTKNGLGVLSDGRIQVFTVKDNLPDNVITALAVEESSVPVLWIGTKNGVAKYTGGHFIRLTDKQNRPVQGSVTFIASDHRGNLWICMEKKVLQVRNGAVVKEFSGTAFVPVLTESVITSPEGDLMFATRNRGVFVYRDNRFIPLPGYRGVPFPANRSLAFLRDFNGQLIMPSWGHGVFVPQGNGFRQLTAANSGLPNDTLWGHWVDREGNIWLGTHGSGVTCLSAARAAAVTAVQPRNVSFIYRDRSGRLWIAGTKMLEFRRPAGDFQTVLRGIHTTWISEDAGGGLWFGTGNGLYQFRNGMAVKVPITDQLPQQALLCVEATGAGELLLLLTNGRVYRYLLKSGQVRQIKLDGFVQMMQPDPDQPGQMILMANNVLYRWKHGHAPERLPVKWKTYRERLSCFFYAGPQRFFLGGSTLELFENGNWTSYGAAEGMDGGRIVSLRLLDRNDLWIGTLNGVYRYQSNRFTRIDKESGLAGDFCSPHALLPESGVVWVGTSSGLSYIRLNWLRKNNRLPGIVINGLKNGSGMLHGNSSRAFPYNQNNPEFSFSSLSFVRPDWNRYKCRLEGFDARDEWRNLGNRRTYAYHNLPPGEYRFEVLGSNNDDLWALQPAVLSFVIKPPYWQQTWFYLLCAVCGGSGLYLIYRWWMQRVTREQQLLQQQNQRLLKLDRLKDEILSNTSHELRTPLHGMVGIAESLLGGIAGELSDRVKENLQLIVHSGQRLSRLINDLLEFSKLRNHDVELQLQRINLAAAGNMVMELLAPEQVRKKKNLELVNAVPPDLYVCADEQRLEQILYNLIGNAVKFTESGQVILQAEAVTGEGGAAFIAVTVADSGCGVVPEDRERIFSSFEQGDNSISRAYGGTGLGLAITKHLVALHGGSIRVEPNRNGGSRFIFELPAADSVQPARSRKFSPAPGLPVSHLLHSFNEEEQSVEDDRNHDLEQPVVRATGQKVLVVDDEMVNRRLLENNLRLAGYRVESLERGEEVLQRLSGDLPAVVLLDVMMPGISGLEITRRLREQFSMYELPIILLTARNQPDDLLAGFEAGANDYLVKPFHRRELLARVGTLAALRDGVHAHVELAELEKEMSIARTVQQSILNSRTMLSSISDLSCSVFYRPMNLQVGGDYYNVSPLPDGGYSLLVADATGHGVQAALTTMQIDMLNRSSLSGGGPAQRLSYMNMAFTTQLHSHNFFTAVLVHWYPDRIVLASAGHPVQFLAKSADRQMIPLNAPGRPVGLNENEQYQEMTVPYSPDDILVLFTDGLLEQDSPEGHQFDESGLLSCFSRTSFIPGSDLQDLLEHITRHWNAFRGYQQVRDDVTVMLVGSPNRHAPAES